MTWKIFCSRITRKEDSQSQEKERKMNDFYISFNNLIKISEKEFNFCISKGPISGSLKVSSSKVTFKQFSSIFQQPKNKQLKTVTHYRKIPLHY